MEMTRLWKSQNDFHSRLEISQRTRDSHIPTADHRCFRSEERRMNRPPGGLLSERPTGLVSERRAQRATASSARAPPGHHRHDAVHTRDLPAGNRTTDAEICRLADLDGRVVVTKDADFVSSHLLTRRPGRLLLVSVGN